MKIKIMNLCGYTEGQTPMRSARIEQSINNKRVRFTPVGESVEFVGSFAEWLVNDVVGKGFKPAEKLIEYGYQYISTWHGREKQWCKLEKPKKEYWIVMEDKNQGWIINKTQYQFAVWLTENFKTLDDALKADSDYTEKIRIAEEEKLNKEREEEEEQQRIKNEKQKYRNHCLTEAAKYIDSEIWELYKRIFAAIYGSDYRFDNYNGLILYICAQEIDNEMAKDILVNWLYNENKGSIKFFEVVSGCKLPKTYKERVRYIRNLSSDQIRLTSG